MNILAGIRSVLFKLGWQSRAYSLQTKTGEETPLQENGKFNCVHGATDHSLEVRVRGTKIELNESPYCPACTEIFLEANSTVCAACEKPILPGESVAQSWYRAKYPYTHLFAGCCASMVLYCGIWGNGRLITLHELKPGTFPKDTGSIASHTYNTGETISGKFS